MAESTQDSFDSMLWVSDSKLVQAGLKEEDFKDDFVMFINAGGKDIQSRDSRLNFKGDSFFDGGYDIETDETIIEDLHFAEIVNTSGPKGIRVLSEFDIFAIVGANKPLQVVGVKVSVDGTDALTVRFEGRRGGATVCGICVRRASELTVTRKNSEYTMCSKCATDIEASPSQNRNRNMKFIAKYEKQIQDLNYQCKLKSDECYQAWVSLHAANDELEKLKMDHDNKLFQAETLEQIIEQQTENLREVSEHYQHDKELWVSAIRDLEEKIKVLKQEHHQLSQRAHECASSIPNMNMMVDGVQALVAQCEDLKMKYNEELTKRKKLYNQVQESKGNIRVFCRCRPLSKEEGALGYATVVDFDAAKDGDLGIISGGSTKKTFKFDRVFTPKDNQADVYADASPLVTSVLDGYNVCIFAYGQTGTGKTFTMEGNEQNRGVNYRTLEELFKIASERKETFCYSISVSVLEVYNEQIRDLLATSPSSKKLEVRQAAEGLHHVPGIVEAKVENIKEVWNVLQAGSNARAVGSNNVNEHSSRSHCMLCIMVKAKNLMSGEYTNSKLWLVDLAGSERLAKTDVQGERLKEAQNINRSLSALGDVISALATKNSHIPYRNSKLTHLLQDSLGGDSKALMFVQISPSEYDLGETMSSLNFASRVRGVELGPARKQIDTGELQKAKQMLDKLKQELRIKDESLRKFEENCQNLENKVKGKEQQYKSLQEKNKELEGQLESKMQLQSATERQHWQLSDKLKGKEEACIGLQQKVKELEHKLKEQQHSEFMILQEKVKELESRLKEQMHSESLAAQKVKELEFKLNKEREQFESILEQKVKELEQKQTEERELQDSMSLRISTPMNVEPTIEIDPQILRNSNSINKQITSHSSILLKGRESLHEIKRKREAENCIGVPTITLMEKKIAVPCESNRVRKIDPSKAFGRLTRSSKGVTAQKVGINKEKDRLRSWVR
ncbi:uncharacterized protein A4U43_C04F33910 [Asparagus officinalis]|uniref:Kinesin-like protein n=1 Tax=Asparagus officinalis TaxID=4686 RepID=A0A5P1F8D4_ASPOF|nr:uncharacterized protein A4U43_C04F33910 [Asparagus officinalis]